MKYSSMCLALNPSENMPFADFFSLFSRALMLHQPVFPQISCPITETVQLPKAKTPPRDYSVMLFVDLFLLKNTFDLLMEEPKACESLVLGFKSPYSRQTKLFFFWWSLEEHQMTRRSPKTLINSSFCFR